MSEPTDKAQRRQARFLQGEAEALLAAAMKAELPNPALIVDPDGTLRLTSGAPVTEDEGGGYV